MIFACFCLSVLGIAGAIFVQTRVWAEREKTIAFRYYWRGHAAGVRETLKYYKQNTK